MIFEQQEIPLWPAMPPLSRGDEKAEELLIEGIDKYKQDFFKSIGK